LGDDFIADVDAKFAFASAGGLNFNTEFALQ
jgi:hypothetical protein